MEKVIVALTAVTASAAFGLLTPPTRRHLPWAGPACVLLLLAASGLVLLTEGLMLAGDFKTPLVTAPLAASIAFPAFWLARTPSAPPTPPAGHDDAEDDDSGGGGDPRDPEPGPPAPSLDWDAFDEARVSWATREREPAAV